MTACSLYLLRRVPVTKGKIDYLVESATVSIQTGLLEGSDRPPYAVTFQNFCLWLRQVQPIIEFRSNLWVTELFNGFDAHVQGFEARDSLAGRDSHHAEDPSALSLNLFRRQEKTLEILMGAERALTKYNVGAKIVRRLIEAKGEVVPALLLQGALPASAPVESSEIGALLTDMGYKSTDMHDSHWCLHEMTQLRLEPINPQAVQ